MEAPLQPSRNKIIRHAERKNLRSRSGRFKSLRRCDYRLLDEGDTVPTRRGLFLPTSLTTVHKGISYMYYTYFIHVNMCSFHSKINRSLNPGSLGFKGITYLPVWKNQQHLMIVRVQNRFSAGRRLPRLPHEVRAIPLRPPRHGGRRAVVLSIRVRIKNNKSTVIFPQRYTSILFVIFVSAN